MLLFDVMKAETLLVRSAEDRGLPSGLFRAQTHPSHRPRTFYHLVLHKAQDVDAARSLGVPVFAIRDSLVRMLGYPMRFPTMLLLPRHLRDAVETDMPIVEFLSERAVRDPQLEDIPVALLLFDVLAARAVAERNRDLLDTEYLLKRIIQEDLEEEATKVRFQDILPSLPTKGKPLPRAALERVLAGNRPRGLIP